MGWIMYFVGLCLLATSAPTTENSLAVLGLGIMFGSALYASINDGY